MTLTDPRTTQQPTSLKPVLDIIPEHCYQRSTARAVGLVVRDLAVYGLAVWGLIVTDNPFLLVPLWLLAGLAVSGLFVIGHDAAHGALVDSKRLNAAIARVSMLPSLHAVEGWKFGHNRVHHGHTLRQGLDFVWHPLTVDEYRQLGPLAKLRHRVEWGPAGSGLYYLREVWWNKMWRFAPPDRWRRSMRRDQGLVAVFAVGTLAVFVATSGVAGLWLFTKVVVVPFLLFCQTIGWVVYIHHIAPDIRWWPRRQWNKFHGQVEGTTIFWASPAWEFFFHWIMVHIPHHVDMRIPCYRLPEAARAIAAAYPDDVHEKRLYQNGFWRSTKVCKLYDFEAGAWVPYPADDRAARSEQ